MNGKKSGEKCSWVALVYSICESKKVAQEKANSRKRNVQRFSVQFSKQNFFPVILFRFVSFSVHTDSNRFYFHSKQQHVPFGFVIKTKHELKTIR